LLVRSSLKQEGVGWPALFLGYREPVTFCGFLIRARLTNDAVLSEFLVNYLRLQSVRQSLVSRSGKVAITNINQGNLRSLPICLPPMQEQKEVAEALRMVDGKIAAEEQRKAALQALFKSMLQQLMTGQIRLREDFSQGSATTEVSTSRILSIANAI
jgi:type I restriction enzyme S subunit